MNSFYRPFPFSQAIEKRIAQEKKAVFEKRETETRRQHMDNQKDFEAVSFFFPSCTVSG
jgi:hypothetical protein